MIAFTAIIALATLLGAQAQTSPPPANISFPPRPPPLPVLPNITCNQFLKTPTNVSNSSSFGPYAPSKVTYNVCFSWTLMTFVTTPTFTTFNLNLLPEIGGFPHVAAPNVTQNLTLGNITTVAECNQILASISKDAVSKCQQVANKIPSLPGTGVGALCSAQYYCCATANCNTPIWYSGAGKVAVSSILLVISLIAAVASAGVL